MHGIMRWIIKRSYWYVLELIPPDYVLGVYMFPELRKQVQRELAKHYAY